MIVSPQIGLAARGCLLLGENGGGEREVRGVPVWRGRDVRGEGAGARGEHGGFRDVDDCSRGAQARRMRVPRSRRVVSHRCRGRGQSHVRVIFGS